MKTAEEWYNDFLVNKSPDGDLDIIEQIQTEAWNEAIEAAAESAEALIGINDKPIVGKQSILKLKLQQAIEKAKPNWDKVTDVDEFLDEIR